MKFTQPIRLLDQIDTFLEKLYIPLIIIGIASIALLARITLIPFQSGDYIVYFGHWYDFIKTHGEFRALQYNFSDYNPPYLYFIWIATHVPLKKIWAIKGISIAFDFFLAFTVYLLVSAKHANKRIAFIVAASSLFLPTVLLNSAMWGQSDAIYVSFCLLSLSFLLKRKGALSCLAVGVALSFKLQAIFFLPVLVVAVLKKEIRALYLLFIPLVYALSLLPAMLAGRSISSLLQIYSHETQEGAIAKYLTANATNVYLWIPNKYFEFFNATGIYFTLGLILILFFLIAQFSGKLNQAMLLRIALLCALFIPFFLPQMHDRYFYLAETLSIVYAVYFPRYFYIPILLQIPAICVYLLFLVNVMPIPEQILPFFLIATISIVAFDLIKQLHSQSIASIQETNGHANEQPEAEPEQLAVKV